MIPTILCYLWNGDSLTKRQFLPEHVMTLARSIRRVLSIEHRFACISDAANGLDGPVWWIRTPEACRQLGEVRTLEGGRFPSCYRRLWTWSEEAREVLGDRVMVIDIDLVAISDFAHLFKRTEPFVGWRPLATWGNADRVGGGIYLLTPGAHPEVFNEFYADPAGCQRAARLAGYRGSDQAWISYKVGRRAPVWPNSVGIYSIRDMKDGRLPLPADAALVQFNGPTKPWQSPLPWVLEHWR